MAEMIQPLSDQAKQELDHLVSKLIILLQLKNVAANSPGSKEANLNLARQFQVVLEALKGAGMQELFNRLHHDPAVSSLAHEYLKNPYPKAGRDSSFIGYEKRVIRDIDKHQLKRIIRRVSDAKLPASEVPQDTASISKKLASIRQQFETALKTGKAKDPAIESVKGQLSEAVSALKQLCCNGKAHIDDESSILSICMGLHALALSTQ